MFVQCFELFLLFIVVSTAMFEFTHKTPVSARSWLEKHVLSDQVRNLGESSKLAQYHHLKDVCWSAAKELHDDRSSVNRAQWTPNIFTRSSVYVVQSLSTPRFPVCRSKNHCQISRKMTTAGHRPPPRFAEQTGPALSASNAFPRP